MAISPLQMQAKNYAERIGVFVHEHPTTVKVLRVAGLIAGVGLMIASPFTLLLGLAVAMGITGGLLTLASAIAFYALDLLAPPHHDMATHVYKEGVYAGGRLFYENDVPILSLDADDPFQAGKAHGYLCGEGISRVTSRFDLVLHRYARQPRAKKLPRTLAEVRNTIKPEHVQEMEGLAVGYNQWASEQKLKWHRPLTVDDVILFHLMPDSLHFRPASVEAGRLVPVREVPVVACTTIVHRNERRELVVARNMDWPSLGVAGAYSVIINRKHANGLRSTVEVAVPGMVGTCTGMNDQGLALAMNVCSGQTDVIGGMPAALYNRDCLERCGSVEEVEQLTQERSPLGPYHLTLADQNGAKSIHFYQSPAGTHVVRQWEEHCPLTTLNFKYTPHPEGSVHHDPARLAELNQFFAQRGGRPLEEALAGPCVNNWISTHRVKMVPQTREFGVAFDNAFAGRVPLHAVPAQRLFIPDDVRPAD
jgi:hypothetical protein